MKLRTHFGPQAFEIAIDFSRTKQFLQPPSKCPPRGKRQASLSGCAGIRCPPILLAGVSTASAGQTRMSARQNEHAGAHRSATTFFARTRDDWINKFLTFFRDGQLATVGKFVVNDVIRFSVLFKTRTYNNSNPVF